MGAPVADALVVGALAAFELAVLGEASLKPTESNRRELLEFVAVVEFEFAVELVVEVGPVVLGSFAGAESPHAIAKTDAIEIAVMTI